MSPELGFAWYGRLSTNDRLDPALSFPSQRSACEHMVANIGGRITRQFADVASGAQPDRPGWSNLVSYFNGRKQISDPSCNTMDICSTSGNPRSSRADEGLQ